MANSQLLQSEPASLPKRRVSFILHKFSRGGSDRVAAYLARGFADAGIAVELIVFSRGGEVERVLFDLLGADIPVYYLGHAGASRAVDLVRGIFPLVRRFRSTSPDVVISTANNTALATAIAVGLVGLWRPRLVLKTTNPIATSRHRGLLRRLRLFTYRTIFRWTDAVWTLSADESEEMRREFPDFANLFCEVANPYVTPEMLELGPPATAGASKTVLTIARLTAQKRLDLLIAAFARLKTPETRLVILGEGEDRPALEGLVRKLGLGERVSMPGYVKNVSRSLHEADLFVLTSDYEGLPAALLEAMAANCRVLTTNSFPSARSLLANVDGTAIIDDTRPEPLAALMDKFLAEPRPLKPRSLASSHSIGNGVASHLNAVERLL